MAIGQNVKDVYLARGGYEGTGVDITEFAKTYDPNATGLASGSQSIRRRGSAGQTRVGLDSRVRDDGANAGSSMGEAMSGTAKPAPQPEVQQQPNRLWQGARQATDLASIQQRVLQSFAKPK